MKQYLPILLGVLLTAGASSCSKPDVEIVESNYSYTLDENKITVDIPDEYVYNNSPLFFLSGKNPVVVQYVTKPNEERTGAVLLSEKTIPVTVSLSKVSDKDVVMNLGFSEEKNTIAKEQIPTAIDLPIDKVVFPSSVVIPAGKRSATFNISLSDDLSGLIQEGLYLTTLAFTTSDGNTARPAKGRNMIVVSIASSSLTNVEGNVVYVKEMVANTTLMDREKMTAKTVNANGIGDFLIDGDKTTDIFEATRYVTPKPNGTIEVQVSVSPAMVKGFTLYFTGSSWFGANVPSDFDVYVSGNNGASWFKQGSVNITTQDLKQNFIFLSPVNVTTVQLRNIKPAAYQANFVEWEFYAGTGVTEPSAN